mmetsp:Transcript_17311/g.43203  ORF Transcript_17311/g.43203 Transcript_17311/m.43203 type:complete len:567 (-) Transcript_17311:62-1762(-)
MSRINESKEARRPIYKAESVQISESVDSILANELNKLSFRERESINDEIHGINIDRKYIEESGVIKENPDLLSKHFRDMQTELDCLRSTESGYGQSAFAFNRSQELFGSSGTYLNTTELRIMFLRCERFDCKKASRRLCLFADLMNEVYGDFALQRHVRLSDLDDEEVAIVKSGWSQILPGRDRAGRRIYMNCADNRLVPEKSRLRIPAYCLMSMLSCDVDSQRRGIVAVMWMHNISKIDITDFVLKGKTQNRCVASIPVRIGAGHFCFPTIESSKDAAFSEVISRLTAVIRPHIRIHTGSPMECVYILESFGISSKQQPVNIADGTIDLTNNHRWIKLCVAREENANMLSHIIECPEHSDILFGRGQTVMNHPGNIMFRNFIHCNLEEYSNIKTKKGSTQWTWGVVRKLKSEHRSRFLKEERIDNDITAWVEVSNETARNKVRIAFRDARTRQTKALEKETKKHLQTRSNGIFEPTPMAPISESSSSILSKRKSGTQNHPAPALDFSQFNSSINLLNNNISQLNSDLGVLVQVSSSSTSDFLGLDGSNYTKRQRLDSQNRCFEFV